MGGRNGAEWVAEIKRNIQLALFGNTAHWIQKNIESFAPG